MVKPAVSIKRWTTWCKRALLGAYGLHLPLWAPLQLHSIHREVASTPAHSTSSAGFWRGVYLQGRWKTRRNTSLDLVVYTYSLHIQPVPLQPRGWAGGTAYRGCTPETAPLDENSAFHLCLPCFPCTGMGKKKKAQLPRYQSRSYTTPSNTS